MRRLVRIFLLMSIHVSVVCTVVMWGAAQVGMPGVNVEVSGYSFGVAAHPEGLISAVGGSVGLPSGPFFHPPNHDLKWQAAFKNAVGRKSVLGNHLWLEPAGNVVFVGIRFWLVLTALLCSYIVVRYLTRRKRRSRFA